MTWTFELGRSLIFVDVSIWRAHAGFTYRFALDTGATRTVVRPEALGLAGYDLSVPSGRTIATTGSGVSAVDQHVIERIQALGIESRDLLVSASNLPPELDIDGLFGLDFFRDRRLAIDFRDGTIAVE